MSVGLLFGAVAANATMISGVLNTSGSVSVSNTLVHFFNTTGPNLFNTEFPLTGSFVGATGGTIDDLVGPPYTTSIVDFVTVTGGALPVMFDLVAIPAGSAGTANCSGPGASVPGNSCTPVISGFVSPFTLTNLTQGVQIGLTLLLEGYTGTSASGETAYSATFSTTLSNGTIASVLSTLSSAGSVTASYQGNFNPSAIPEPGTMLLLGGSLVTVGLFARRRLNGK
jgi:hypothetical protein